MYHGTPNRDNFTRFDVTKIGSANDDGSWGSDFYFSNLQKQADQYRRGGRGGTGGGSIYPSFLSIKNPFQISDFKTIEEIAEYLNIVESNFVEESTGEFSTESDDIRFRQPYFYSPTEQALNSIKQEKATPEQWKAMLLKNGAKEAEMDIPIRRGFDPTHK